MSASFTREILHSRHQLSHQQIDDFLNEQKSSSYPESKAASLARFSNFLNIKTLLDNKGVRYVCLKGAVLSWKIYQDPTYRFIGDFDFLLDFEDIEEAVMVLQNNGFEIVEDWLSARELWKLKKFRNQILLHNPATDALVELHWRLIQIPPVNDLTLKELVHSNLKEIEIAGHKFYTFNDELELLYLVMHGGLHNWFRLKWLEDVHQLALQKKYDPEKFKGLAVKLHAQRMVNLCNALLAYIYPGEPQLPPFGKPFRFAVNFAKSRINNQSKRQFETFPELISYTGCILTNFPGIRYKLRVIRFILYSMKENNVHNKDAHLPFFTSVLQPLKYLKRRYRLQQ